MSHLKVLEESVFQVETKWPQFKLLLEDISILSKEFRNNEKVVSFERTLLYGGYSLIAPLFKNVNFISIDCSPKNAEDRGAYNYEMINKKGFEKILHHQRNDIIRTQLEAATADLVIVPNLVHHVREQDELFSELNRICKVGGKVYIFESILRELHQEPNDFIRYTPYGLSEILKIHGFDIIKEDRIGGVFDAIRYCWIQALEYIDGNDQHKYKEWFKEHEKELISMDRKYKSNITRENTSFPTGFSIHAIKIK